ncbi:MAG: MCP four helix bundle domain-containing protein, partial [Candidatus Competibacter denitrificans]
MLTIILILGLVGYYGMVKSDQAIEEIGDVRLPSVEALLIMSEAQTAIDGAENALLLTQIDAQARTAQHQRIDQAKQRADAAWKIYEPLPQTSEEAAVWKQFIPAWKQWSEDHETYMKLIREFEALGATALEAQRDSALYKQIIQQALVTNPVSFGAAEKLLTQLVEINRKAAADSVHESKRASSFMELVSVSVLIAGLGLAILLSWLTARAIRRPIGGEPADMAALTQRIAQGDLTVQFDDTGKETGVYAAMRDMTSQLKEMVSKVSQSTGQVASASSEIAQGSSDLAQRTEEQASALEETASSMEELTGTVKQSAENAGQANQLAGAARTQAEQGGQVVDQAVAAMGAIHQSSKKIADIIGVI